ncbi:cytochrome c biogenesis protein CcsA [Helicobacter sp. 23-1048]
MQILNNPNASLKLLFANMKITIALMAIYAIACGIATFIERDLGTLTARAIVYDAWWFDVLHLWLALSLLGSFITAKAWQRKKYASLLLHFSFVVIIFGAGITRFFGFEGQMPIEQNTSANIIYSAEPYLVIQGFNKATRKIEGVEIPFNINARKQYEVDFFDKKLYVNVSNVGAKVDEFKNSYTSLDLALFFDTDLTQKSTLFGDIDWENLKESVITAEIMQSPLGSVAQNTRIDMQDYVFFVSWGSKSIALPFYIHLDSFVLERYAGSNMPSSYESFVEVQDEQNNYFKKERIFMNNVLDYGGYRFFQSSYFPDESGTILSVNNDPGKVPTYIGYTLLIISMIWLLVDKNSRFRTLARFVKSQSLALIVGVATLISLPQTAYSMPFVDELHEDGAKSNQLQEIQNTQKVEQTQESNESPQIPQTQEVPINMQNSLAFVQEPTQKQTEELLKKIKDNSLEFSNEFGKVLLQDFGGRIKPLDTIAGEYVHKVTNKDGFLGLNNVQIFLGAMVYPQYFRQIKMFQTKSPKLRTLLGNDPKQNRVAAIDAYAKDGTYILHNYVNIANIKPLKDQDTFDKDVIDFNEKLYMFGLMYSAKILRVVPDDRAQSNEWYDFEDALESLQDESSRQIIFGIVASIFQGFVKGVEENDWNLAFNGLQMLKAYQKQHGSELILSDSKIAAEVFLNHSKVFYYLTFVYITLGLVFFGFVIASILRAKSLNPKVYMVAWILIAGAFLCHSAGLALRWYVSGHAPWSNAYESMLYIAWACALSGVAIFARMPLALSAASFMSGITLLVAFMGDMNPQIGNLVPVLKSYWLNIHVSVITASYGFFGLCFILGIITLVLFIMRSSKRAHIDSSILSLGAINEMSMILGLFLLTIGNFLGGIWANESWGRYWGWDSKETWSLISIGVYAIILHIRFLGFKNMPIIFASASVLGFFSLLMTYFGVNYFLTGMHSYAQGEAEGIPYYIYIMIGVILALIFLATRNGALEKKL